MDPMISTLTEKDGLQVAPVLVDFIEREALPGTGIDAETFWKALSALAHDFGPKNRALLERRGELQTAIDAMSEGRPKRFTAWRASASDFAFAGSSARSNPASSIPVSIQPGQMALHRMSGP